jgi:hypothetical protein
MVVQHRWEELRLTEDDWNAFHALNTDLSGFAYGTNKVRGSSYLSIKDSTKVFAYIQALLEMKIEEFSNSWLARLGLRAILLCV